ncbi:Hypothetical predicted protein [Paramuricea clavata]|uniref:Uncharacterized protein n=1 Tax=Paramuricea clavata TaxID=317549 RepID=A0A7D9J927_PARCT|nr:Hypothetical predicted protein [Paramuricea clavata]
MAESSEVGQAVQDAVKGALSGSLKWKISPFGGDISFIITTDNIDVAERLLKIGGMIFLGVGALTLGSFFCYNAYKHLITDATKKAVGGDTDDQEFGGTKPGSLHVLLHCLTDKRFLEVLADYESGRITERMEIEFSQIGIKTEGLKVEIENMEEVNEIKAAINKRYLIN